MQPGMRFRRMEKPTTALIDSAANKHYATRLEGIGHDILKLPPLGWKPLQLGKRETEALHSVTGFDWVVFTDTRAAWAFGDAARGAGLDLFEMDSVQTCALGESAADHLRFLQVHADVIPRDVSARAVIGDLREYLAGERIEGMRFLVIHSEGSGSHLCAELERAGTEVRKVRTAEHTGGASGFAARVKALILGGEPQNVFLGSAFDLQDIGLMAVLTGDSDLLAGRKIICGDASVLACVSERGLAGELLPVQIEPDDS